MGTQAQTFKLSITIVFMQLERLWIIKEKYAECISPVTSHDKQWKISESQFLYFKSFGSITFFQKFLTSAFVTSLWDKIRLRI